MFQVEVDGSLSSASLPSREEEGAVKLSILVIFCNLYPYYTATNSTQKRYFIIRASLQSNLKKIGAGKQSRRKSCLCWAPDVIFHEKEDSDCVEVFPPDIQIRMDQFQSFIEPSVRLEHYD